MAATADPPDPPAPPDPPLILTPLSGPPIPDTAALVEEGRRRHEAELAVSQRLVAQARAGSPPPMAERPAAPPPPEPGQFRIDIDWRGETACYIEHDRRVRLECFYWGGPAGRVSHLDAVWEYVDGRREPLTPEERALVLRRTIEHARTREDIALRIDRA